MKVSETFDEIRFEDNYLSFPDFYEACKEKIYRKFVSAFEDIYISGSEGKRITVFANVDGVIFDSVFDISRENAGMLSEYVRNYFEEIEDYETCGRIVKMYPVKK